MPNGKYGNMIEDLKSIYKGKKVFLTGHTGFKGSWLLKILSMLGAEVKGYALNVNTSQDLYCLINGDNLCYSVIDDLRNKENLISQINNFKPDFLFHLAAQPLVRLSYEIPAETFEVNAIGTCNVLDGLRELEKACSAVLITTDKVYHNYEWLYPYRENDRLGGYDPYSASKACSELIIDSYRNSFFNAKDYHMHKKGIAVARAGNVIGGGDWSKDRLIPDITRALTQRQKIIVRNPQSVRPWQHVLEPLFGYLELGAKLTHDPVYFSSAYNFGPYENDALNVNAIVKMAIESWGEGECIYPKQPDELHEASLLKLDISKALKDLSWRPKLNAAMSIMYTIDWYKEFSANPKKISKYTEAQIFSYINE